MLHVDTKEHVENESVYNHKDFIAHIEDLTQHVAVRSFKTKAAIEQGLMKYVLYFEHQTAHPVEGIHTDSASESKGAWMELGKDKVKIGSSTVYVSESTNSQSPRTRQYSEISGCN